MELRIEIHTETTRKKEEDGGTQVEDTTIKYIVPDGFPDDKNGERMRAEFTEMMMEMFATGDTVAAPE